MRFSTRGRYGTRAMHVLARYYGQGPVPLRKIARDQGISEAYLEQLVSEMRKAGLVKSVRGSQGGYMLARPPEKVTVGDVVRVLEGPIAPTECVANENGGETCRLSPECVSRRVWERVRDSMQEVLDSVTLADMLEDGTGDTRVPNTRGGI